MIPLTVCTRSISIPREAAWDLIDGVELLFRLREAAGFLLVGDFLLAAGDLVLLTMAEDPSV